MHVVLRFRLHDFCIKRLVYCNLQRSLKLVQLNGVIQISVAFSTKSRTMTPLRGISTFYLPKTFSTFPSLKHVVNTASNKSVVQGIMRIERWITHRVGKKNLQTMFLLSVEVHALDSHDSSQLRLDAKTIISEALLARGKRV